MRAIYHIAVEGDLRRCSRDGRYEPDSLGSEGFVHCADEAVLLLVANDYYGDAAGRVLVLKLDPSQLTCDLEWEAPAPLAGGGTAHLAASATFPHVYGPIDLRAVAAVGELARGADGRFAWPARWLEGAELRAFLSR